MKRRSKISGFGMRVRRDVGKYKGAYILVFPVILFYLLFCYKPLYGILIAFKDFSPGLGIWKSKWADHYGMQNFIDFFSSYYFGRILKNTIVISLTTLLAGFPAPILFALLLNEIRNEKFKRLTQTISYMPHFISLVVVCAMIKIFTSENGFITYVISFFKEADGMSLLSKSGYFVPIYVLSGIWQELGWGAIIYLAALAGVDETLYEAARIDGANRWQQTLHVTLPGISGTIIIMFLLRIGNIMNVGYEKIILLYNQGIYDTADVISSFVFRKGLVEFRMSYSAAVGIFNSLINFAVVLLFNKISKKVSDTSLW